MAIQGNTVSADLFLNHGKFEWWSFHDANSSDLNGCGGLTGPMAIIASEETPPRKFIKTLLLHMLIKCCSFPCSCIINLAILQRVFLVTLLVNSASGVSTLHLCLQLAVLLDCSALI